MTEDKANETRVFELHCKRTMCTYSILAGDLSQEEQLRNINVFCVLFTHRANTSLLEQSVYK